MSAEECATIKDAFAGVMDDLGDQILDMAFGALVGMAMEKVKQLSVTNRRTSSVTGERGMHPTKDDVSAQKGSVGAAQTDARANTSEATASEAGATAVRSAEPFPIRGRRVFRS